VLIILCLIEGIKLITLKFRRIFLREKFTGLVIILSKLARTHHQINRRLLSEHKRVSAFFVGIKHTWIKAFFPKRILFASTAI
jgi:hypothetical protein